MAVGTRLELVHQLLGYWWFSKPLPYLLGLTHRIGVADETRTRNNLLGRQELYH